MIFKPRHLRKNEETQNRDRWMISYADLITLLLGLFIVLYAAADKDRAQKIVENFAQINSGGLNSGGDGILPGQKPASGKDRDDRSLLENPVLVKNTKMRQTAKGLTVSLSEAGFFSPGEAFIGSETRLIIRALAADLKNSDRRIQVEGHTDSRPISNARYPSNWELSTARASSVLAELIEAGIAPERLSAAGYGGFQPVAENETAAGRAQNRRVDIVVLSR